MIEIRKEYTLQQVVDLIFINAYNKQDDKENWKQRNRTNYISLWKWVKDELVRSDKRMWINKEITIIRGAALIKFLKGRNPKMIKSEVLQRVNENG